MRRADIEVPNPSVDVSSWEGSACYPRSTFYPLSDAPPTRKHRITRPGFRPCSSRRSRSQAPFCPCTQRTVAKRAEGTFGNLRYPLGGDHPSQTTRQALSPPSSGLGDAHTKGGISLAAPPRLAPRLLSLPPMLHMVCTSPMPSCSKGSRGLFVPWRAPGVFTGTTISPRTGPRQCPGRYTIRAGRNLPAKEFRYLRTVIVTAAVYRGFGSGLAPLPLTFRHRAGVRPYT